MARSRYQVAQRRSTRFLDREAQRRSVAVHLGHLLEDPTYFRVFEVVGLGGIGKTRLLNEIRTAASEAQPKGVAVWVPLDAEAAATETGPLWSIRQQLGFDCLLFDAAILRYWSITGQPFQPAVRGMISKGPIFQAVDAAKSVAGVPLPLTFSVDVFNAAARRVAKFRRYRREEFAEIDELRDDARELRSRLPHYLGLDVARMVDARRGSLVVFYDGYDRLAPSTKENGAEWLREFIGTVDRGLHFVSSRELLRWPALDWDDVSVSLVVGELPEAESRAMIRERVGPLDVQLETRMIEASHRVPFFLEAVIDAYESLAVLGPVTLRDLPDSPDSSVRHLLDHLDRPQRAVSVALSSVQVFDEGLLRYLVQQLNIAMTPFDSEELTGSFFVEPLGDGLFKTHDLLTDFVRSSPTYRSAMTQSLVAASQYLAVACCAGAGELAPAGALHLLHGVLAGWARASQVPTESAERLVDAAYGLYDAGYWTELAWVSSLGLADRSHPVATLLELFAALASRRTADIDTALRQMEQIEPRAGDLGRHERSVAVEIAYMSELSGNYARARHEFQALFERPEPVDLTDRSQLRSRLYHADMLIMDGQLEQGSRVLLETTELLGSSAPLDWAELVRHRGHAHRFSYLLEDAERLYLAALRVASDAPAMVGKLHTNLGETYAWVDPERALDALDTARTINHQLRNRVEVAKGDAARGIALARLGDIASARAAAKEADHGSRVARYPAGVAFALQARVLIEWCAGEPDGLRAFTDRLRQQLVELDTYGHLCAGPALLAGDRALWTGLVNDVGWIRPAGIETRLRALAALR